MNEPDMPFGERRLHERKSCTRIVQVKDSDSVYNGHLRDLAVGGAFIEPPNGSEAQIGQDLMVTIPFGRKKELLTLKAKVAWVKPSGMGISFIKT